MDRITINGKFLTLSAARSGVYRVAHELLIAIDALLAADDPRYRHLRCEVVMPGRPAQPLALRAVAQRCIGGPSTRLKGIPWEQFALPLHARGSVLLNLCNLGPVLYPRALTMIHDAQVYLSPGSYSRPFLAWYRTMLPLLGRRNRAILTVSGYSREQLDRHGVAAATRIHVVHNGCDHVLRTPADATAPARHGLRHGRYVMALATVQAHKNIRVLLRAFADPALADMTLVLFGAGSAADFHGAGVDVPANMRFVGRIDDAALAGLLQGATALAFPSLTEGFGLPPLEAMRLGCPAIVAPCGALPEVCGAAALQAAADDPQAWTAQVLRLRREPALAADLRQRGLEHAARFTWAGAAARLLDTVIAQALPARCADAAAAGALHAAVPRSPPTPGTP